MNNLVFDGKTYTYQEEERGTSYKYTTTVVRNEDNEVIDISHWDKVRLQDVQVGNWVVVVRSKRTGYSSRNLCRVERITKTQLTVNGMRYLKSTGRAVGGYNPRHIEAYNPINEITSWAYYFTRQETKRVKNELKNRKEQVKTRVFELIKDADMETLETLLEKLA